MLRIGLCRTKPPHQAMFPSRLFCDTSDVVSGPRNSPGGEQPPCGWWQDEYAKSRSRVDLMRNAEMMQILQPNNH